MGGPSKNPGPRFERGDAAPRMREAAARIIEEQGLSGLSFRALARDEALGVSHSAPLHHFGTTAGLLGAVAAEAFAELAVELREERASRAPSSRTLERLARRYAAFALRNPHLYLAIHSPELWSVATGRAAPEPERQNPPGTVAREREIPWVEAAVDARNDAFAEFVYAVQDITRAGHVRRGLQAADVARMITALVDGYLFQVLDEQVAADAPSQMQIDYLGSLVRLALHGVQPSG